MLSEHKTLVNLDRMHLIHPVAALRAHEKRGVTILKSGRGMFLTDMAGHEVIDAFSGLWCVNVGYGRESIVQAAMRQMNELAYATGYFGFASEPAVRLAQRLSELAPGSLPRVFFTLGGSDAVDSAIRYIVHYYNSVGKPEKKHFIALERAFHGSSGLGAGMTALSSFHRNFDLPLPWQHHIPSPYPYRNPLRGNSEAIISESVRSLRTLVERLGADKVAAFFCEPIQGAGGVIVPPRGWLRAMRDTCRELDILFVADEVITGFGRTGPMFACEHEQVAPDMMTVAKGLTSGYLPMGAVMMSEAIYSGIADSADTVVGHGLTYSGHPVSAAVGLEVLRLYTEGGLLAQGRAIEPAFAAGLGMLREHPLVGDVRSIGLLGALELVSDKQRQTSFDPSLNISQRLFDLGYRRGVIFRAFNDGTIGLAPALCCTQAEMELIFQRIRATLDDLLTAGDVLR